LPDEECARHIGWDIGALEVSRRLSESLDATLIHQRYSRLVIDCNRPLTAETSIPLRSDGTEIPGNAGAPAPYAAARASEIFTPYHSAISSVLDARAVERRPTILLAMHSFTPRLHSRPAARPWQIGVLFNRDHRFAEALIATLREEGDLTVGVNEPYTVDDASDYAIPVHGEKRGVPHALIEVRQDLITTSQGQSEWAARLARVFPLAAARMKG
jgi:predicted N-formylglutamate amidohydrolase